ncbi:PE family protein [Mycobacterium kyorinense]|uniref:PE family protein n=1 Tax=Mycobacterium kyorinense TaxID=487514 RepID=A0A1X1XR95_9MYCO|nr:PE family protein [Mycobacterium kyorinense]ORW01311.1 PE family protein [Mycobacterium kyorinense]
MATQPEGLAAALTKLQGRGAALAALEAAIAAPPAGLAPAASDEVSALMATQFALHGEAYQAVSAQARAMHEMFVGILAAGAAAQAATDAADS